MKVVKIKTYKPSNKLTSFLKDINKSVNTGQVNGLFVVATAVSGDIISGYSIEDGCKVFSMLGGIESAKKTFIESQVE